MPRETGGAGSPEAVAATTIDAPDRSHPSTTEALPLANREEAANRDGRGVVLGRVRTTTLDADGNYRFDGIAVGTTVVVIASVPRTGAPRGTYFDLPDDE